MLELTHNGDVHPLERGAIVVLGGDQVYPVPTSKEYTNRFLGLYRSAMPCAPSGPEPEMFAIPGSHDWYDGLINVTNIFCCQRRIGGWTTSQTRSYFAIRLPHRWWLWGVDLRSVTTWTNRKLAICGRVAGKPDGQARGGRRPRRLDFECHGVSGLVDRAGVTNGVELACGEAKDREARLPLGGSIARGARWHVRAAEEIDLQAARAAAEALV